MSQTHLLRKDHVMFTNCHTIKHMVIFSRWWFLSVLINVMVVGYVEENGLSICLTRHCLKNCAIACYPEPPIQWQFFYTDSLHFTSTGVHSSAGSFKIEVRVGESRDSGACILPQVLRESPTTFVWQTEDHSYEGSILVLNYLVTNYRLLHLKLLAARWNRSYSSTRQSLLFLGFLKSSNKAQPVLSGRCWAMPVPQSTI